jgi:hypothetical protein
MRKFAFSVLLLSLITLTACWSSKQQLYTTVTNQSGITLRAIEVNYPGGSFGIPELKPGTSNRKWVFVTPPCTYTLNFEDANGKQFHSKPVDLGKDKCPAEVALTIDSSMNVSVGSK